MRGCVFSFGYAQEERKKDEADRDKLLQSGARASGAEGKSSAANTLINPGVVENRNDSKL